MKLKLKFKSYRKLNNVLYLNAGRKSNKKDHAYRKYYYFLYKLILIKTIKYKTSGKKFIFNINFYEKKTFAQE